MGACLLSLFDLVFQYLAERMAGENVSEMTYFVSGGMQNLFIYLFILLLCIIKSRMNISVVAEIPISFCSSEETSYFSVCALLSPRKRGNMYSPVLVFLSVCLSVITITKKILRTYLYQILCKGS